MLSESAENKSATNKQFCSRVSRFREVGIMILSMLVVAGGCFFIFRDWIDSWGVLATAYLDV